MDNPEIMYKVFNVKLQRYVSGCNRSNDYYATHGGALRVARSEAKRNYNGKVFEIHKFELKLIDKETVDE